MSERDQQLSVAEALRYAGEVAPYSVLDFVSISRASFEANSIGENGPRARLDVQCSHETVGDQLRIHFELSQTALLNAQSVEFIVSAVLVVQYRLSLKREPREVAIDCFARINGLYHVWPYWREFVQSCSGRAGLPPLTLAPLLPQQVAALAGFRAERPDPSTGAHEAD